MEWLGFVAYPVITISCAFPLPPSIAQSFLVLWMSSVVYSLRKAVGINWNVVLLPNKTHLQQILERNKFKYRTAAVADDSYRILCTRQEYEMKSSLLPNPNCWLTDWPRGSSATNGKGEKHRRRKTKLCGCRIVSFSPPPTTRPNRSVMRAMWIYWVSVGSSTATCKGVRRTVWQRSILSLT